MKLKESVVNHIVLDSQDEAVKRFFLSLPDDAQGSVVELNGRALACVLPPPKATNGTTEEWSDAKNNRRCDLIDREFDGPPLTPAEVVELAGLQKCFGIASTWPRFRLKMPAVFIRNCWRG